MPTHEVFNQSTPLADTNLFANDAALMAAAVSQHAGWANNELHALGATLGRAAVLDLGRLANQFPPQFKPFDRSGRRIDTVEFHPAWHQLMALLIGSGVHADPWADPKPGAQVARAAKYLMFAQVENGVQCPVTMTFAVVPVMQKLAQSVPAIARDWLPRLLSHDYDPSDAPAASKRGLLMGMGMTEKQGGSDVRSNTTTAELVGNSDYGTEYLLTGHKWFFSAPQCDAHLVLAQTEPGTSAGISCFFVPRILPDGKRNAIRVQRLKDKVGNKSNASSEVEFEGASGWLVGQAGRGIPTILEMGSHTRLDCAIGSAGQIRAVVAMALHHASERSAFGKRLIEQPLMQNVLGDLALESEAATFLALRLAASYDARTASASEAALCRLLTPAAKYWICKRGPMVGAEAMEVMGGNGYVEDAPMGRFYRELPLNSIWEGSGNIMCLDVQQAFSRSPDCRDALLQELALARGANARYDAFLAALNQDLRGASTGLARTEAVMQDASARRLTERIALAMQASLLLRNSAPCMADAFCAARLAGDGHTFGTLPVGLDLAAMVARGAPH
jgi:putative acyl-CoA dehydrogenase